MDSPAQVTAFTRLNVAIWRDLGDYIGLHGLQKLWWTGSRALQGTMKRVLFRSLRGTLYKESIYKSKGSAPSDTLPSESVCFELQAQEVVLSPWPGDPSVLKLRRLSQYYLASFLVTNRSIRASIPLDIPVASLTNVAWLRGWQKIGQMTLVASDFDPSVIGSHAAPVRLTMEVCELREMMTILPNLPIVHEHYIPDLDNLTYVKEISCHHLVSLSLSLPVSGSTAVPTYLDLQYSPSLVSFTLHLVHFSRKDFGRWLPPQHTVKLALGPGVTHVALHNDVTDIADKIKLELEGDRQQLQSLELWNLALPDPHNEVSASIESLKLVKCHIYDGWTLIWPLNLRHLVLEDCYTENAEYSWKRSHINPLNLPRTLESIKITSSTYPDPASNYTAPEAHQIAQWSELPTTPFPDLTDSITPALSIRVRLHITDETLQGSKLPCTNLKRLQLDSGHFISSLALLPESLASLRLQTPFKPKLAYEHSLSSIDDQRVLLRALSSRSAMLNQLEPYASLSHVLPNLASAKVNTGIWNYFVPLDRSSNDMNVDEKTAQEVAGARHIDVIHWLMQSIGDLLYVRESKDEGPGTRGHARRLAGQWRIWKVAHHWTAYLSLPAEVTEFCATFGKVSPSTLKSQIKLAGEPNGSRAIWDIPANSFYAEILKSWRDNPFEWKSLPSHLERIEIRGIQKDMVPSLDFRPFRSLRYLFLAAQEGFQFQGLAEHIFTPSLLELILLFEFKSHTFMSMSQITSSAMSLKRLVLSYTATDTVYRSIRTACPALESIEIVPFRAANDKFTPSPHGLALQVSTWRRYMENLALMQAEARIEGPYEPSATLCHHFSTAQQGDDYGWSSTEAYAHGLHNLTEEQRTESDASVIFSGLGWASLTNSGPSGSAHGSGQAESVVPKVITLEDVGVFLEKKGLPYCHFNRFILGHNLRNWNLPDGTHTMDLSINAAEVLEGWSKFELTPLPLKYSFFESYNAVTPKDYYFGVMIDSIAFPATLTHLTLTAIRAPQSFFNCLPPNIRKLHIFNQYTYKKPLSEATFPRTIEDIYTPGINIISAKNMLFSSYFPKPLTRLVCSSDVHDIGSIPSHLVTLVINGKVLKSLNVGGPSVIANAAKAASSWVTSVLN